MECQFSLSRKGIRVMNRQVITDSSNVTMVHLAKDGGFESMGQVIRIARGPERPDL